MKPLLLLLLLLHPLGLPSAPFQVASSSEIPNYIRDLKDPDWQIRDKALRALAELGPAAKDAVPELVEALKDDPMGRAAWALGEIGPEARSAVPALLNVAERMDTPMAFSALVALGNIGPDAQEAIPVLRRLASSGNPMIASAASHALSSIGPEGKKASVAIAIRDLADSNEDKRWKAALDLWNLGKDAAPAVPALIAAMKDSSPRVRGVVPSALGAIGSEARSAAPALVQALEEEDGSVCLAAVDALARVGADPEVAVPAILRVFQNGPEYVRGNALMALGSFGPTAAQAAPTLIAAMQDPDVGIRMHAAKSLGLIGPLARVEQVLRSALHDRDARVREVAEEALGLRVPVQVDEHPEQGVEPIVADLPTLVKTLNDGGPDARRAAAALIKRCREDFKIAGASYVPGPWNKRCSQTEFQPPEAALNNPDVLVRRVALEAVAALGPRGKSAVSSVTNALEDTDPPAREMAVEALGLMGPAAAPAVPALIGKLRKRPYDTHLLMTIGSIGEPAKDAAPLLASVFRDKQMDIWNRQSALSSLVAVAPHDRTTRLALDEARSDPSPALRALAAGAPTVSVAALMTALKDEDDAVRERAMDSFLQIQVDADVALSVYVPALKDRYAQVRRLAAVGLEKVGAAAKAAIPQLIEAVADPDAGYSAIATLGNFGPDAIDAVSALTSAMQRPQMVECAAEALAKIGPAATPAVTKLAECLTRPDSAPRAACAAALGRIGAGSTSAIPALIRMLQSPERPGDREAAAAALGNIGIPTEEVRRALGAATKDEYDEVRQAATGALAKLNRVGR